MNNESNRTINRARAIAGILVILMVVFITARFFIKYHSTVKESTSEEPIPLVEVNATQAGSGALSEYITLNGVTQFLKTGTIRSHVTGYISDLHYNINSYIKKGAVFCSVKTKEQAALRDIQKIDTSLKVFNKALTVLSNVSGLITTLNVHSGDYVAEGEILAVVKEPSSLILVINVPFEYNQQIHKGTPCEVLFSDGQKMKLSVSGILPTVEAASQTQSFYINLPNKSLPENLNVTIHLMTQKSNQASLTIPISALQTDELENEFWVMRIKNGMAFKTQVVPGTQNEKWVEIKSGNLSFGDSIVTEGSYKLDDSSHVSIKQ